MRLTPINRLIAGCGLALCLASTVACGGGGGDDGHGILSDGDSGSGSLLAASFVPDEPTPGPMVVSVSQSQATGNMVTVVVRLTDIADVFTAGFDVHFDPALVAYVGWAPGTLLESGGHSVIYSVAPQAGKVIVGASRTAPASGAEASGSRDLILLTFRATASGSSSLTLGEGFLLDSQPPGPTAIPGISWSGGQILAN